MRLVQNVDGTVINKERIEEIWQLLTAQLHKADTQYDIIGQSNWRLVLLIFIKKRLINNNAT